ncbi:MAG: hypothetical protein Q9214_002640 [Letrouitia sp. 1 TL-2023]
MTSQVNSVTAENVRRKSATGLLNVHQPVQPSSTPPASISQTASTKRRRPQDSEAEAQANEIKDVRPCKQPRKLSSSKLYEENLPKDPKAEAEAEAGEQELPPSKDQLSEKNLRALDKMDGNNTQSISVKRNSSRRSIVPSETDSSRSQRSSNTTAYYRYKDLEDANLYIHTDPPETTKATIDQIINAKSSADRYISLRDKSEIFWKKCKEMVRGAAGEDDFVHLFYQIVDDMSPEDLIFREKADWREELKPTIQQSDANLSFLLDFNAPSPKRHKQSAGGPHTSPQNSQTNLLDSAPPQPDALPPSASPSVKPKETSRIKTPRPDITAGIKESAIISRLASSQNFSQTKAKHFLDMLQDTTMPSERDSSQKPVLITVPTQRESNLTFPSFVFEGKGYSTGKQIFEAENQASVAGACGLKIQIMLDELVKRATRSSDVSLISSKNQPQLFFSICSEGPYHELWAHYTLIEDGERQFKMVLLDTCNGTLLKQVESFLVEIDNIMIWTMGTFLDSLVDHLAIVAKKAEA